MNQRPLNRWCLRALCVLVSACATGVPDAAAIETSLLPIPEVDRQLNWYQRQRVRYVNARLLRKTEQLRLLDRHAEARPLLERARDNDPHNVELSLHLIDTYTALERWDDALAVCDTVLADTPGYLALAIHKGFLAAEAGKPKMTAAIFEHILPSLKDQNPNRPAIYRALSQAHAETGGHKKALHYAEKWAAFENDPTAHQLAAEEAVRLEDWNTAIEHYEQALEHEQTPKQLGRFYLNIGYLFTRKGSLQKARASFHKARGLLPTEWDQLEVEQQLGQSSFRSGLYADAAGHFKGYLLRSFDELVAVAYLRSLLQAGQAELAVLEANAFAEQLDVSATFRLETRSALLTAYRDLRRDEDYYQLAQELFNSTGRNEYLLEAATAAERTGRAKEASDLYQRHLQATAQKAVEHDQ